MPVLAFYSIYISKLKSKAFSRLLLMALFFSWCGDIVLQFMQKDELFFVIGLISFLIAHIFYIIFFTRFSGSKYIIKKPYLILPFLAYGFFLMWILYPDLADMKIPVSIYALVILLMSATALNRIDKVDRKSFLFVFIGAILFTLSDSLIAINTFSFPFDASRFLIMSLYVTAQFLIIEGCLLQDT